MGISIVGAGITGLTTALSLHAAGLSCVVFEAVAEPVPLGVGINLPHAMRELTELDLLPDLPAVARVNSPAVRKLGLTLAPMGIQSLMATIKSGRSHLRSDGARASLAPNARRNRGST